jgi:hypothetical protein
MQGKQSNRFGLKGDAHFTAALTFLAEYYDLPRATVLRKMVKTRAKQLGFHFPATAAGQHAIADLEAVHAIE